MSTPTATKTTTSGFFPTMGEMEAGGFRAARLLSNPGAAVTGSITNSAVKGIQEKTMEELEEVKKFVLEGHGSWKVLGFIAGVAMLGGGLYNLLYDALGLQVFNAVVDAYITAFGALSIALEYKEGILPDGLRKTLIDEFLFVFKPYGRSFLYILFGLLMFSQQNSLVYMIIGPYVATVGCIIYYYSIMAGRNMAQMKASTKLDDTHLRSVFNRADKGIAFLGVNITKDGTLNTKEFAKVYMDLLQLKAPPSCDELEIALLEVDTAHNGNIDFQELKAWYNKKMDGN